MAVKAEKNTSAAVSAAPAGANAAPGNGGEAPKRRGRAKGTPAGPRLIWTDERNAVLARTMSSGYIKQEDGTWVKNPAYNGSTCTATSVAQALAEHPAFANPEAPVTPERVKAYVQSIIKAREKDGKPVHEWLNLSRSARTRNTSAFD